MAKGSRARRRIASLQFRTTPYSLPALAHRMSEDMYPKKCSKALDKKDWEDATCSVCMECPHNAVLLLCSCYVKGCRPYMCGTSFRFSNCLDQYKKAYTKVLSSNPGWSLPESVDNPISIPDSRFPTEKCEVMELACPLCRGQVKGWTVVEPAREFLNAKQRNCMQEDCSFVGTYKELKKHMKADHPSARPREVDPLLQQKWRRIERERERDDVISTVRSTMPGAVVFGDYVIEGNHYGFETGGEDGGFDTNSTERDGGFDVDFDGNLVNVFLLLHAFGSSGNDLHRRSLQSGRTLNHALNENDRVLHTTPVGGLGFSDQEEDDNEGNNNHQDGISLVSRLRRHGRVLLNRSGRRRRQRN